MYSSRRRYSYRSRNYRYRKRMNNIYAPGNSNFDLPSYHQMKGRTIQVSPRTLFNPPTSIPPPDEYDQMYKKLVKAGYGPVVNPPQPPPPPSPEPFIPPYPQILTITNSIEELFPIAGTGYINFTNSDLQEAVSSFDLPDIPTGYHYEAYLYGLTFDFDAGQDSSRWKLTWHSTILSGSTQRINLAEKTQVLELSAADINHQVFVFPYSTSAINYYYLSFTGNNVATQLTNANVNSTLDISKDRIPLISTAEDDTNYLRLDNNSADSSPQGTLSMYVLLKIVSDT